MSEGLPKLNTWRDIEGAPDWKETVIMEQGKYRVKFRHLKTNRSFFHPQAQDFLNMVSLELEEEPRKCLKKLAVKTMSNVKNKNKENKEKQDAKEGKSTAGQSKSIPSTKRAPEAKPSTKPAIEPKRPVEAKRVSKMPVNIKKKPIVPSPVPGPPAPINQARGEAPPKKQRKGASASDIATRALQEAGPEPPKGKVGDQERKFWNDWKKKLKTLEKKYTEEAQAARQPAKPAVKKAARPQGGEEEKAEHNEFADFRVATRAPSKTARGRERRLGKSKRSSAGERSAEAEEAEKADKSTRKSRRVAEMGSLTAGEMNSMNPVLPAAAQFFSAQRLGGKGLKAAGKAHANRQSIIPDLSTYQNFERLVPQIDPLHHLRQQLLTGHMRRLKEFLWQLHLNFNILFFGVGDKRALLRLFVESALSGEDVLSIDGSEDSRGAKVAKALLDAICISVLKVPHLGANCLGLDSYVNKVNQALLWHYHRKHAPLGRIYTDPGIASVATTTNVVATSASSSMLQGDDDTGAPGFWAPGNARLDKGGVLPGLDDGRGVHTRVDSNATAQRYAEEAPLDATTGDGHVHTLSKLYVAINAVDGAALQSPEAQRVISTLARCPAVAVIATTDKLNAPLLWSNETLDKYRWYYVHAPTYESHDLSSDFALLNSRGRQGNNAQVANANALGMILASLTPRHKELFTLLARESLKEGQDSHKGIPMDAFFDKAVKAMLVTTRPGLQNYLREFTDHKVIATSTDGAKKEWVRITLPRAIIEQVT